jgi:hypothetical protein
MKLPVMPFLAAAVLLLGASLGLAAQESSVQEALAVFQRASGGAKGDVEPAIAAFKALAQAEPGNPVFTAYLGSAESMRARDAWLPWNKIKYAEEGLDHIDRALATLKPEHDRPGSRAVPPGLETKLVAATTFLRLPDSVFHRAGAGRRLVAEILASPSYAGAPAPFRSRVEALK